MGSLRPLPNPPGAPARARANSRRPVRQEFERVDRFAQTPDLEMKLRLGGVGTADFSDLLAPRHVLSFLYQQVAVVGIGGQIGLVVLDDDEFAVTTQAHTAVDDASRRRGKDRIADLAEDVHALVG